MRKTDTKGEKEGGGGGHFRIHRESKTRWKPRSNRKREREKR